MTASDVVNPVQFYHGSNALLSPDDLITSSAARGTVPEHSDPRTPSQQVYGPDSPYKSPLQSNSYFSTNKEHAAGFGQHLYEVEPVGKSRIDQQDNPWVTGTAYRSLEPLRVVRKAKHPWR